MGQPISLCDVSLSMENVARRFGRRVVFSDISGKVDFGHTLVVTGPNGSGKSTLLKIVAGLLPPTNGTVHLTLNGTKVEAWDRRHFLGMVAPDVSLYSELTGAENLLFFARLRGIELDRAALVALLDRVGLKGRGRDRVVGYSSGMRQRLKYAFALLHQPLLLILDEPTANLDEQGAAMAKSIIEEQRMRGIAVVATNESGEVAWGDSVISLNGSSQSAKP